MTINLFWCLSNNVGDALNPWLVSRLSQRNPVYVSPDVGLGKYVCCGSILNHATETSVVWGAGIAAVTDTIDPGTDIRAVRGPLSRMRALASGAKCPEVYGDPAILLPRYYRPAVEKKYKYGIVPHFKHEHYLCSTLIGHLHPDILAISPLMPVESFVDAVCSCERIVSSSLHGMIIANAYGIPATWIQLPEAGNIGGDGMKFYDYALSVGVVDLSFVTLRCKMDTFKTTAQIEGLRYLLPQRDLTAKLLEACPFYAIEHPIGPVGVPQEEPAADVPVEAEPAPEPPADPADYPDPEVPPCV